MKLSNDVREKVRELFLSGKKVTDIADECGVHWQTVMNHTVDLAAWRTRPRGRRTDPATLQKIRDLYLEHVPLKEIANACGVSERAVIQHTRDLPRREVRITESMRAKIRRLYVEGWSYVDIQNECKVHRSAVARATVDIQRRRPDIAVRALQAKVERLTAENAELKERLASQGVE